MTMDATTVLKKTLRYAAFGLYFFAGLNHFLNPALYIHIMPAWLPLLSLLNAVSGIAEMALAILLLTSKFRRLACFGLVLLLMAVFPANINMAIHPELTPKIDPIWLYLRLPLQGLLIAWVIFIRE